MPFSMSGRLVSLCMIDVLEFYEHVKKEGIPKKGFRLTFIKV